MKKSRNGMGCFDGKEISYKGNRRHFPRGSELRIDFSTKRFEVPDQARRSRSHK